jgi:hypothetical protein
MPNEQLQNYIQESIKAGGNKEDIKKSLIAAGWQEPDIEEVFRILEAPIAMPVPAAQSPEPKKHGRLVWIIVAIVLVIVIGIGAYLFFAKPRVSAPVKSAQTQNQTQSSSTTSANVAAQPSSTPPAPVAASCTASGPASEIYIKGTVTSVDSAGKTQTITDDCADATYMEKYICYESPAGSGHYASGRQVVKCTNGCANGACKK